MTLLLLLPFLLLLLLLLPKRRRIWRRSGRMTRDVMSNDSLRFIMGIPIPIRQTWRAVWKTIFLDEARLDILSFSYFILRKYIAQRSVGMYWEVDVCIRRQSLHCRHNERDGVSNHRRLGCLLNRLFSRRWKKHLSSTSLAFERGNHQSLMNSPHKEPVMGKMFPFDDVSMDSDEEVPWANCIVIQDKKCLWIKPIPHKLL